MGTTETTETSSGSGSTPLSGYVSNVSQLVLEGRRIRGEFVKGTEGALGQLLTFVHAQMGSDVTSVWQLEGENWSLTANFSDPSLEIKTLESAVPALHQAILETLKQRKVVALVDIRVPPEIAAELSWSPELIHDGKAICHVLAAPILWQGYLAGIATCMLHGAANAVEYRTDLLSMIAGFTDIRGADDPEKDRRRQPNPETPDGSSSVDVSSDDVSGDRSAEDSDNEDSSNNAVAEETTSQLEARPQVPEAADAQMARDDLLAAHSPSPNTGATIDPSQSERPLSDNSFSENNDDIGLPRPSAANSATGSSAEVSGELSDAESLKSESLKSEQTEPEQPAPEQPAPEPAAAVDQIAEDNDADNDADAELDRLNASALETHQQIVQVVSDVPPELIYGQEVIDSAAEAIANSTEQDSSSIVAHDTQNNNTSPPDNSTQQPTVDLDPPSAPPSAARLVSPFAAAKALAARAVAGRGSATREPAAKSEPPPSHTGQPASPGADRQPAAASPQIQPTVPVAREKPVSQGERVAQDASGIAEPREPERHADRINTGKESQGESHAADQPQPQPQPQLLGQPQPNSSAQTSEHDPRIDLDSESPLTSPSRMREQLLSRCAAAGDYPELAYTIVNELRDLIGCDRVTLVDRTGDRFKVMAISGQPTFDKRSSSIKEMERLSRVAAQSEKSFSSTDDTLPPQLEIPFERFIAETRCRAVSTFPLFHSRFHGNPTDQQKLSEVVNQRNIADKKNVGVLLFENMETMLDEAVLQARFSSIAPTISDLIGNSKRYYGLLFMPLWLKLSWFTELFTGKTKRKAIAITSAVIIGIAALFLIPDEIRIRCEGELTPRDVQEIYATEDGRISEILVSDGQEVTQGQVLANQECIELKTKLAEANATLAELEEKYKRAQRSLAFPASASGDRSKSDDPADLDLQLRSLRTQVALAREKAQRLSEHLLDSETVIAPISGIVFAWNVEQRLNGRPVTRGQRLFSIAQAGSPLVLELQSDSFRFGYITRAYREAEQNGEKLLVDYKLASEPYQQWSAQVDSIASATDLDSKDSTYLAVRATPDDTPEELLAKGARPGTSVTAKVSCGRASFIYCRLYSFFDWTKRTWFKYIG